MTHDSENAVKKAAKSEQELFRNTLTREINKLIELDKTAVDTDQKVVKSINK